MRTPSKDYTGIKLSKYWHIADRFPDSLSAFHAHVHRNHNDRRPACMMVVAAVVMVGIGGCGGGGSGKGDDGGSDGTGRVWLLARW
jgi:hypothetical protein